MFNSPRKRPAELPEGLHHEAWDSFAQQPSLELLTVPFVIRPLEDSRFAYSSKGKQPTKDRPSSRSGDIVA